MTETTPPTREVVGLLADRAQFEAAVERLMAAGFHRTDLSVLSSHDSIDTAGRAGKSWPDALRGLVGELRYEGPLVAAGLIAVAAGPVGATIASLIAAGVGGAAIKELLDEVAAVPHTEAFARELASGGVILWVAAPTPEKEAAAMRILTEAGARSLHVNERAGD